MDYIKAKNKYGEYCIPETSKHRISCKTVLRGEVWEEETVDYILKNCEHELIHAGAYFGDMLPAFSTKIKKIWAFEPNSENYRAAKNTIKWNNLKNINLMNAALGEKESIGKLEIEAVRRGKKQKLGGASNITNKNLANHVTQEIRIVAIDDIIPADSDISIIHLDIEDYELFALRGAMATINRCSPILILETKHNKIEPNLQSFLEENGYKKITNVYHDVNSVWKRTYK